MILQNVYMIDPLKRKEGLRDLVIAEGKIVQILPAGEAKAQEGETIIQGNGLVAAPGLVDVHVHFRDPGFTYKEDIFTGAKAAAAGGFTTIVLMANTKPAVDQVETLRYVLDKGAQTGLHILTCANITMGLKGQQLTDMETLADSGAVGFTDDGIPILDEKMVVAAMEQASKLGLPLSFHEEDPAYITNNGIHAGAAAAYYGIKGSPREAEISMIERDIKLAETHQAHISIQHISTKEGAELVRQSRQRSPYVHAEVTPHHFTLTEQAAIAKGTLAKMNPPLREEADRVALIEALKDGTIEMIATDHAPHSAEEKAKAITEAPSGIIGLETSLALGIRELVQPGHLSLMDLMDRMSTGPAKLYHLDAGYLAEGGPADLVLFAPDEQWTVDTFVSKSQNSPFIGETMPGRIYYTICDGNIVYQKD